MEKIILVTGATGGIGKEVAANLARQGHTLVLPVRNLEKAETLRQDWQAAFPACRVFLYAMDLADLQSVRDCADRIRKEFQRIDILVNNAGTWEMEFRENRQGIEMNFAVNHLAPMLLTLELLPLLRKAPQARIINTSSGAHRRNIIDLEDPEWRHKPYDGIATYSQSKLCNLLFTLSLSELVQGSTITVNSVHPGYVRTELFKNMGQRNWEGVPGAAQGARSTLFAALDPSLENRSGLYIYLESEDTALSPMAKDKQLARRLWDRSLEYLGPYLGEPATFRAATFHS